MGLGCFSMWLVLAHNDPRVQVQLCTSLEQLAYSRPTTTALSAHIISCWSIYNNSSFDISDPSNTLSLEHL